MQKRHITTIVFIITTLTALGQIQVHASLGTGGNSVATVSAANISRSRKTAGLLIVGSERYLFFMGLSLDLSHTI